MVQENQSSKGRKKSPAEIVQDDVSRGSTAEKVRWAQIIVQAVIGFVVALILSNITEVRKSQDEGQKERNMLSQGLQLVIQQSRNDKEVVLSAVEGLRSAVTESDRRHDLQVSEVKAQQAQFESKLVNLQTDITVLKTILSPTPQPSSTATNRR
jgi:prolyl oligopeptidase PreP (S9A serine peptidase family)